MTQTANVIRTLSLVVLVTLTLPNPALAQSQTYQDVTVVVESLHTSGIGEGYGEFRATLTNHSKTQAHKVTLLLPNYGYDNTWGGVREIRKTVELAPLFTADMTLFSPALPSYSSFADVMIDGVRQPEQVTIGNGKVGIIVGHSDGSSLLLSQQAYKNGVWNAANVEQGLKDSSGEWQIAIQSYEFPVSEWSQNWMSYARFGGVVLLADELAGAPEAVRSALLRYVERGGVLIVAGNWQPPVQWQARLGGIKDGDLLPDEKDDAESPKAYPTPTPEVEPKALPKAKPRADLPIYYVGFGAIVVTGAVGLENISVNQWKRLRRAMKNASLGENNYSSLAAINQDFPVVEQFGVPVRGLFLLMLVFVIVIGPVNLIWLAKKKRKIWMLWTIPAISLLTCLIVAGFSLFGEGWNATTKTEALTILDETAHRATTIGWAGFYSPITPSEGLHFSYDTELAPQVPQYWDYRRTVPERKMDWTNDQHLEAGWIAARIPAFFKVRKSEARRERLNIRLTSDGATLVNGLGADIVQVWWADANGKIYSAESIAAGAQASMRATDSNAAASPARLRDAFTGDWLKEFKAFAEKPEDVLMPNCYLAVLNGAPFVEEGLKDVKLRAARNLVYGVSDQNHAR